MSPMSKANWRRIERMRESRLPSWDFVHQGDKSVADFEFELVEGQKGLHFFRSIQRWSGFLAFLFGRQGCVFTLGGHFGNCEHDS